MEIFEVPTASRNVFLDNDDDEEKKVEGQSKSNQTTEHKSLHDYIEDFCYDLLGDNHGGWEINEGQSGGIDWNSKDDVINHNYTQFIEQSYDEGF